MTDETCTIVMYHYVRDLDRSRYPEINALETSEFEFQLDYLESEYTFVSMSDLQAAIYDGVELPSNPVLLTFDDGFLDHYTTVFPRLRERGIEAAFFPPAEPILSDTVLNVHKIHFILANVSGNDALLESVFNRLDSYREQYNLESNQTYYDSLAEAGRWDPAEIIFVKRLLQRELDYEVRSSIINDLFAEYVDVSESVLSRELYMQPAHLRTIIESGMYIGSHGATHRWLGSLSADEQRREIDSSIEFLDSLGASTDDWAICYPYGSYGSTTLDLLQETDCSIGLTTEVGEVSMIEKNALTLERLDTNNLPQSPDDLNES